MSESRGYMEDLEFAKVAEARELQAKAKARGKKKAAATKKAAARKGSS